MDFVCKLYGNTYAVHVFALVDVATLNLALPPPPPRADVANSKRHQRLAEILISLPALYRKSAKLFVRKLRNARIYNKLRAYAVWNSRIIASVCCANRSAEFRGRIAWQSLLKKNFADFSDVVLVKKKKKKKKIKISSGRWWRFQLATSFIGLYFTNKVMCTLWFLFLFSQTALDSYKFRGSLFSFPIVITKQCIYGKANKVNLKSNKTLHTTFCQNMASGENRKSYAFTGKLKVLKKMQESCVKKYILLSIS